MINIDNITKSYPSLVSRRKYVYQNFSVDIPPDKNLAILGANGAGKSTLIRMIGGLEEPDSGRIATNLRVSWPLGLGTGIIPSMSGRENTEFVCRVHGVSNIKEAHEFVMSFSELGKNYEETVRTFSSGMKSRLAFSLSLLFKFDVMLLDEIMSVGDARFQNKCKKVIEDWRASNTQLILVSHSESAIKENCQSALVLTGSKPEMFDNVEDGLKRFKEVQYAQK
ncbi:ABC transporter ATP-binding protein [Vibrio crassostreae]|uniref:ABC transporter ATP-binding protein n=1 Tax=Vibrio crassostreae TaxID=246167 RepID=UPI001B30975B|nr:ABC transporter ATP-binding protein [Vibrio crassostreae]